MKKFLTAFVLTAGILAAASAHAEDRVVAWTGVDVGPDSVYGYIGGYTTLEGQKVDQEGWLLRATAGYGRDRYDTPAVVSGRVTDHVTSADVMVGYKALSGPASAKFFLGPDYQHINPSPTDPSSAHGTRVGAKADAEVSTMLYENVKFGALGSYSTAFRTYWSRVDAGYHFPWFSVGPEALFLGSENYNQVRAGAAIGDLPLGPVNFRLDGGGAWTNGNGKNGGYGGLSVGTRF